MMKTTDLYQTTVDKMLGGAEAYLVSALETVRSAREALAGADESSPVRAAEIFAANNALRMAVVADKAAMNALVECLGAGVLCARCRAARAAIAKAEGEEH